MKFEKGQSGNPAGRPKGSKTKFSLVALQVAIEEVEKEDNINLYKHFVKRALTNDTVLIALMKKLLPNAEIDHNFSVETLDFSNFP